MAERSAEITAAHRRGRRLTLRWRRRRCTHRQRPECRRECGERRWRRKRRRYLGGWSCAAARRRGHAGNPTADQVWRSRRRSRKKDRIAAKNPAEKNDTPLLMKAAEHMAIRFAMERFQKGDIKVNAVHQMLEHMSRQMETLRQILRVHEDKMSKAGILVESHADILDRMFWAEVPEAGKKSVLLSGEAPCVPPR